MLVGLDASVVLEPLLPFVPLAVAPLVAAAPDVAAAPVVAAVESLAFAVWLALAEFDAFEVAAAVSLAWDLVWDGLPSGYLGKPIAWPYENSLTTYCLFFDRSVSSLAHHAPHGRLVAVAMRH